MRQCITLKVHFEFPKRGWIRINVDGACRNDIIGCGGVVRGDVGEWILRFSTFIGQGDPYMTNLWRLYEGLQLARKLKFDKVEIR